MRSDARGKRTSGAEVSNVSGHGFWLLVDDRELFLSFRDFPWFREVSIAELVNVVLQSPQHLYWPDLDVDLSIESIEHPERFPLVSREGRGKKRRPGARSGSRSPQRPRRHARG
jgi:hypothetical protein